MAGQGERTRGHVSGTETNRKLSALLKRLRTAYAESPVPLLPPDGSGEPIVGEIVFSMLLWESSLAQARSAYKRLQEHVADFNELRVCFAWEMVPMLGERYPLASERCVRIKSVLQDIFKRQNRLSLESILQMPREEAAAYVSSLEGLPPFAAARVTRYRLELPAIPVDQRLYTLLAEAGVLAEGEACDGLYRHASAVLERQLKGSDADEACRLFQAWSDDEGHAPRRERRPTGEVSEATKGKGKRSPGESAKATAGRRGASRKKPESA